MDARSAAAAPTTARDDVPNIKSAAEASLIAGLFSDARTLSAAFVVAEVLGPPVALREGGTSRRGSAL